MVKDMTHIVIANDLRSGEIVYLTTDRAWTDDIAKARRFESADDADQNANVDEITGVANTVVGVEAIALRGPAATEFPVSLRDRIRAAGPTVRLDLARAPGKV